MSLDHMLAQVEKEAFRSMKVINKGKLSETVTSRVGGSFFDALGRTWPTNKNGPMRPMIQIKVSELSFIPTPVAKYELLCLYIDSKHLEYGSMAKEGGDFVVRTVLAGERCVPLTSPRQFPYQQYDIGFEEFVDYPGFTEMEEYLTPREEEHELLWKACEMRPNYWKTKINGHPPTVQGLPCMSYGENQFGIVLGREMELPLYLGGHLNIGFVSEDDEWYAHWRE